MPAVTISALATRKIAVRISMTCAGATMTINLVVRGLEQAGWSAEIIRSLVSHKCAGIEISDPNPKATDRNEVLALALTKARSLIQRVFASPRYWILSGNSAVQPDSAVSRRRGFWGSLGPTFHANLARPATEWQVSVEGGLKFFSAIEKGEISDELMLRLWHKEKTTWLVACDHCDSQIFRSALAGGWSAERSSIPSELLDLASNSNMIFVRGLISDEGQEMGVFAFGERWWLPA
jgi:hypothetical protein